MHFKRSVAGNSVMVLEKTAPKGSKIAGGVWNRNRVRLGHFKETKLLNRIFRAAADRSSERGGKCFP